jgi:cell division protease FtsH
MAGLMGGRVAEEEIFGEPSTGASNDLQQATGLAKMMVRDYGMSRLGPVALSDNSGTTFLGLKAPENRTYSEQTALEVDREIQSFVVEAQERAREVIRRHRDKLDALAARLLAVEVVEEEEMARLWGPKVERPGGFMGRGHSEAPPEDPNHPHREAAERGWPVTQAATGAADSGGEE